MYKGRPEEVAKQLMERIQIRETTTLSTRIVWRSHPEWSEECAVSCWQDVCRASRQAGSASILGWSTVLPQTEHFALHAHCSAGIGPRKASLSTLLFVTGKKKRRARSVHIIKAPDLTRTGRASRAKHSSRLSTRNSQLRLSETGNFCAVLCHTLLWQKMDCSLSEECNCFSRWLPDGCVLKLVPVEVTLALGRIGYSDMKLSEHVRDAVVCLL